MENLKIKVSNEKESKEAQELFFELGYRWAYKNIGKNIFYEKEDIFLYADKGGNLGTGTKENQGHFNGWCGTLVSLPELRALVSLHKNPINMDKVLSDVRSDALGLLEDKEWLNTKTYEYKKAVDMGGHSNWIEIPEDAETAILGSENNIYFWKSHFFTGGIHKNWIDMGLGYDANWYLNKCDGSKLLWKRHTQPEELRFVDDEAPFEKHVKTMKSLMIPCMPKRPLNDQYAEIEKVRQKYDPEDINLATGYDLDELAREYGYRNRDIQESDLCYRESLKIFIERGCEAKSPWDTQVGGNHYKSLPIQPAQFAMANKLDYCQSNAIKYIVRHESKNGKQDLEKAKHYIDLLIEHYYS